MLRPFLIIGVGGSGGKTLRIAREDLLRRLAQAGWTGDLPRAWQFLHIDVPTHADGNDADLPSQLPARDYQGLVAPGLVYRTIDSALAGTGRTEMGDALAGWRPEPNKVKVPVSKGAGQYRTIGRVITVAGLDRVWEAVSRARDALKGAEVIGELQQVTRLLGGEPNTDAVSPTVVVVSSIAGGSGAGAVIDICDVVRALGDDWASESVGLLYAPDVFDYLPEEMRKGVRPNALACLSELLAGYWNSAGPSEATESLLAKHGVQLGAVNRLGPRYPFLVGNRNQHVSFRTQNDIYRSMGRSLASWVASVALQDRMGAYTQTNWSAAALAVPDHLPLRTATGETPFSALGSARVGLGRDRFQDFASESLARAAVDRALRRQEELRGPKDDRLPKKLVADTADNAWGPFLAASQLDERGPDKNDLLDALRPSDFQTSLRNVEKAIASKITAEIPPKGWTPAQVQQRIMSELHSRETRFHDDQSIGRREQARAWSSDVQKRLVTLAAQYIAREGAPVTAELLGKLGVEIRQVRDELRDEAARHSRWAGDIGDEINKVLQAGGAEVLVATTPLVGRAIKRGLQALEWKAEAHLRELASELIPDLADNLIDPLTLAVRNAGVGLATEETAQIDGQTSAILMWPEGDVVPQRLQPAPNEFLIDPPSAYPKTLRSLVRQSTDAESDGQAWRQAVMQILYGSDDLGTAEQVLVTLETAWVPRHPAVTAGSTEPPSRAAFTLALDAESLLTRSTSWVNRPGSRIGKFNAQGLKDYLHPSDAEDPKDHATRMERFEGQLVAALNAAGPLVSVNTGVLVQVHETSKAPFSTFFTEIPLPDRHPARQVVKTVLEAKGMWSNEVANNFTDSSGSSIDIFSVLGTPYEPVVFDSLMKPIASEWGARSKTSLTRAEFWRWRRARPLPEFLPMAPTVREAMVRGWFTASLLGQLELGDAARIFVPSETKGAGAVMDFPDPLLSAEPPRGHEFLPAVLKSIVLALVDVNTRSSLDPVKPYARLRALGSSGRGGEYEGYETPHRELEEWVLQGVVPRGAPTPPENAGSASDEWKERRSAVEKRFSDVRDRYQELFEQVEQRSDVFDVPRAYELRADILAALDDLQRAVRHLEPQDADRAWN